MELIPDEELPNVSREGTLTLVSPAKSFILQVENVSYFEVYSHINNESSQFVLIQAANQDFEFVSGCTTNHSLPTPTLEGPGRIDGQKIGTVYFYLPSPL